MKQNAPDPHSGAKLIRGTVLMEHEHQLSLVCPMSNMSPIKEVIMDVRNGLNKWHAVCAHVVRRATWKRPLI